MLLNVIRLLLPTQNMGVNHGAKVLYSARGLYIQDAATILRGLARERGMKIPMIDVDCSNVCFKVGKNVQSLASFLMRWATPGLRVIPSCDAKVRPISKQATNQRKANRDKNRIKSSVLRKDIRELRRRCYCDVNSRDEILTDINVKERACKTAETASNNVIQTDLAEKLEKELEQSVAHSSNKSKIKPNAKRKRYRKCHSHGCPVNSSNPEHRHIKYHKVPRFPAELKGKRPRKVSVVHRQGIIFHRREILRRMRMDPCQLTLVPGVP